MKTIRIRNSYSKFFFGLIGLFMAWYMILFLKGVSTQSPMLYILAFGILVSFFGALIRTPLILIKPHSILLKNGEELLWEEIAEISVGKRTRNLSFREKMPNPFANHGAFSNYYLTITPLEQPDNNIVVEKKIKLNFSELHPDVIEELFWHATRPTKVMMYREEEVE